MMAEGQVTSTKNARKASYPLEVLRVIEETKDAKSLVFRVPSSFRAAFAYQAGQFLTLEVPCGPGGATVRRCYSLASSPEWESEHKVTVKRIAGGRASNWINDHVNEGDLVTVCPPEGRFCPHAARRAPRALRRRERDHAGDLPHQDSPTHERAADPARLRQSRRRTDHLPGGAREPPLRARVASSRASPPRHTPRLHEARGRASRRRGSGHRRPLPVRAGRVHGRGRARPPRGRGEPRAPPHRALRVALRRESRERNGGAFRSHPEFIHIELRGAKHAVKYQAGKTLLRTALDAGLDAPYSCEEGFCGCCAAQLVEGAVKMDADDALTNEEKKRGLILTCQSRPTTSRCAIEYLDT